MGVMTGSGIYSLHGNAFFRNGLRPQTALLRQVGTNGLNSSLYHGGVEPISADLSV